MRTTVSIPNGMEFYDWGNEAKELKIQVSIPNGMEFYCRREFYQYHLKLFQFPTGWNSTNTLIWSLPSIACFNSQRDGILQKNLRRANGDLFVSIPNGMEFYKFLNYFAYFDGDVSIPNGMEFYALLPLLKWGSILFQFPTGWNSTHSTPKMVYDVYGFNSQRDGILRS